MFFRRRSKKNVAPRVPNVREEDVRVTTIEPAPTDIRQTMDVEERGTVAAAAYFEDQLLVPPEEMEDGTTPAYRPRFRPPMAVLKIMDDNQKTGEMVRFRGNRLIIGRDKGDVVIPHDKVMSGRHAEILRRFEDDNYVWHLHDLQSRNGSYVKIDFIRLRNGDELLIGSSTYVFEDSRQTAPRLRELGSRHPRQVKFKSKEFLIGRNGDTCLSTLGNDPLLEEEHLRITFTKDRWCVMALASKNGVWARVDQVELTNGTRFQLGEQRFQLLIP